MYHFLNILGYFVLYSNGDFITIIINYENLKLYYYKFLSKNISKPFRSVILNLFMIPDPQWIGQ